MDMKMRQLLINFWGQSQAGPTKIHRHHPTRSYAHYVSERIQSQPIAKQSWEKTDNACQFRLRFCDENYNKQRLLWIIYLILCPSSNGK